MDIRKVFLVLADISGYTRFISQHKMSLAHAELIITDLLESVIDAAEFPLQLNKLEGDAALFFGWSEGSAHQAEDVAKQILRFHTAFREKVRHLSDVTMCNCAACRQVGELKLKVVAHHGEAGLKHVRTFEELAGVDVILAHRLLKNSVQAKEYILLTDAFARLSGPLPGLRREARTEQCEGLGPAQVEVYYLEPGEAPRRSYDLLTRMHHGWRLQSHYFLRVLGLRRGPALAQFGADQASP